jgi:hypothetical protein
MGLSYTEGGMACEQLLHRITHRSHIVLLRWRRCHLRDCCRWGVGSTPSRNAELKSFFFFLGLLREVFQTPTGG